MSFWGADCSKLQARSMQYGGDSMQAEDSLWTAQTQGRTDGCLHAAADSTAEQDRMRCSMHQQSAGGSLSLDAPTAHSAGYCAQQPLRRSLPDGTASECSPAWHQQHRPADSLLLPQLSQLASYSAVNSIQQLSITRSFGDSAYVVEQQDQLPRITPPASPAHSEETVGFAPHHSAAEAKSCAEVKCASEDPTDISSHWRATKRRRVAGVSAADSHPAVQRSLELADDAESNMLPLPQWRSSLPRTYTTSFPGDQEETALLPPYSDDIFYTLAHPLDPEQ